MGKAKQYRQNVPLLLALVLIVSILTVYNQVQDFDFVLYDDFEYVVDNARVRNGLTHDNLAWALTTFYASNWHPLTWISHMLDCHFYGLNPKGHHFNNLILHIINVLLLFLVLKRMTGSLWKSWLVAALFAFHPLQVESVAWVAERKNLLSAFFWMLVMWSYSLYVEKPSSWRYILCLVLFALGLSAKPMLVTIPFVMLLLDYWPLKRFASTRFHGPAGAVGAKAVSTPDHGSCLFRLIQEKIPFFCLAALSGLVTIFASRSAGSVASLDALPLSLRGANALVSYAGYMVKMLWPDPLAFFYPYPMGGLSLWEVLGATLLLTMISFLVVLGARRLPHLVLGWLWYLITLFPVIGLVQVGAQAMADRYAYLPLIGLFVMMAWLIPDRIPTRPVTKAALALGLSTVLSIMGLRTWSQAQTWRNSTNLFQHALHVTQNNHMAHYLMGSTFEREGKIDEALSHYYDALAIKTDFAPAHNSLGNVLAARGDLEKAIQHYFMASKNDPRDWSTYYNLGNVLAVTGDLEGAVFNYSKALRIDPDNWRVHNNLGMLLARKGAYPEATAHFSEALKLNPDATKARHNREILLRRMDKADAR